MPHRRNLYKLTGDIHSPDIADDFYWNDIDVDEEDAPASPVQAAAEQVKQEVRRQPLVAMALAVAAGFLLVKLLRR